MMGPRLLYALIVGAVIAAALVLRIWDPSPVARLRAVVFDTYQQISPRQFDPGLPLRIVEEGNTVAATMQADRNAPRRHAGDRLKRLFFKNAELEVIAIRQG